MTLVRRGGRTGNLRTGKHESAWSIMTPTVSGMPRSALCPPLSSLFELSTSSENLPTHAARAHRDATKLIDQRLCPILNCSHWIWELWATDLQPDRNFHTSGQWVFYHHRRGRARSNCPGIIALRHQLVNIWNDNQMDGCCSVNFWVLMLRVLSSALEPLPTCKFSSNHVKCALCISSPCTHLNLCIS